MNAHYNLPQFVFKEYGGLTHGQINWIFISTCTLLLLLGNCGGLKGLMDKAVVN